MLGNVELPCTNCWTVAHLSARDEEFRCSGCQSVWGFQICEACASVAQVGPKPKRGFAWTCPYCQRGNRIPRFGGTSGTARQRAEEVKERSLGGDAPLLGGFTVLGGNGLSLPAGTICSILARPEAVHITAEIATVETVAVLPYEELTTLELSGGKKTTDGGFIGGGFGLQGAVEGMAIASVLNAVTRTTAINTAMHIGSTRGEALLHHGALSSQTIRRTLSALWTRYEVAKRASAANPTGSDDPVKLLSRLAELRDAGILTEEEFSVKKADLLSRM